MTTLTNKEQAIYTMALEKVQEIRDKLNEPTQKETKALINKAIAEGRYYETEDRLAVFKYIATMRYTAHMIGKYDGRGVCDEGTKYEEQNICVIDMYLYIVETNECIHLMSHEWFNTELCKWEVLKYYYKYANKLGKEVYMTHLRGLKYANAYKRNYGPDKTKYQLVTADKNARAAFVQSKLRYSGRKYEFNYVKKHLEEF